MNSVKPAALAVIAGALFHSTAEACSLSPGTFLQSNFELVDASDAIVVARAKRETGSEGLYGSQIEFEVTETLKGTPGNVVYGGGWLGDPYPSDPDNLQSANPGAYSGSCVRLEYRLDDTYVLMLQQNVDGRFVVSGDPFSRLNEDDFGPSSTWRRAIDQYLKIQTEPDRMMQLQLMQGLADRGGDQDASPFERILGADASVHLGSIHPDKPTFWLLAQYSNPLSLAMRNAREWEETPEAQAEAVFKLIYGDAETYEPLTSDILRALSQGNHDGAEPLFREILSKKQPDVTEFGATIAYFIQHGDFETARDAMRDRLLWVLATSEPRARNDFWRVVWPSVSYRRSDQVTDEFVEWFHKQRQAICFLQNGPEDCQYDWDDAVSLLSEPRKHKVLLLAAASSPDVTDWAISEIETLTENDIAIREDDWDFPLKLLVAAYDGEEPQMISEFACGTKEQRRKIAELAGDVRTFRASSLLENMMALPQDDGVRQAIFDSLVRHEAHELGTIPGATADRAYKYARASGPVPLKQWHSRMLPCLVGQ